MTLQQQIDQARDRFLETGRDEDVLQRTEDTGSEGEHAGGSP